MKKYVVLRFVGENLMELSVPGTKEHALAVYSALLADGQIESYEIGIAEFNEDEEGMRLYD